MKAGNAMIELAEARVAQEVAVGVARIQATLGVISGRFVCDCGEEISEARRLACPETDKCIQCATFLERRNRRRA